MKKVLLSISAVVILLVVVSSCSLNNNNTNTPQNGQFLVSNVSPNAPRLNVRINGSLFDTLPYGFNTIYVPALPGTYNFIFTTDSSTASLINTNLQVDAGKFYSLFAIDSFSNIQSALVTDNFVQPSTDSVYVRFFNFSPGLSQQINVTDSANLDASIFSDRIFNDQAANRTYADFIELKAGVYTLRIKLTDGTVLASQAVSLGGGGVYTLFSKGFSGGTGDQAIGFGQIQNY